MDSEEADALYGTQSARTSIGWTPGINAERLVNMVCTIRNGNGVIDTGYTGMYEWTDSVEHFENAPIAYVLGSNRPGKTEYAIIQGWRQDLNAPSRAKIETENIRLGFRLVLDVEK